MSYHANMISLSDISKSDAKKIIIGLLMVAVIVGIYAWGKFGSGANNQNGITNENSDNVSVSSSTTLTETSSTSTLASSSSPATTAPAKPKTMSYTDAVNKYAGRRIQFDSNCVMTPATMSLRNNTDIMLDNRSPSPRSIFIDRKEHRISGYSYKIVTMRYSPLPHIFTVDCGTGRNTGTIVVQ